MDGPTPKPRRGLHFPGTEAKGGVMEMPAQTKKGEPRSTVPAAEAGMNPRGLRLLRCPLPCGQGLLDQMDEVTCLPKSSIKPIEVLGLGPPTARWGP